MVTVLYRALEVHMDALMARADRYSAAGANRVKPAEPLQIFVKRRLSGILPVCVRLRKFSRESCALGIK